MNTIRFLKFVGFRWKSWLKTGINAVYFYCRREFFWYQSISRENNKRRARCCRLSEMKIAFNLNTRWKSNSRVRTRACNVWRRTCWLWGVSQTDVLRIAGYVMSSWFALSRSFSRNRATRIAHTRGAAVGLDLIHAKMARTRELARRSYDRVSFRAIRIHGSSICICDIICISANR